MAFFFFLFAMVKAITPRYRYDQLMRLGWKVFLPLLAGLGGDRGVPGAIRDASAAPMPAGPWRRADMSMTQIDYTRAAKYFLLYGFHQGLRSWG